MPWASRGCREPSDALPLRVCSTPPTGTFLHMDRISARVKAVNPNIKVRAAPVVGFFLDHDNFGHTDGYFLSSGNLADWSWLRRVLQGRRPTLLKRSNAASVSSSSGYERKVPGRAQLRGLGDARHVRELHGLDGLRPGARAGNVRSPRAPPPSADGSASAPRRSTRRRPRTFRAGAASTRCSARRSTRCRT